GVLPQRKPPTVVPPPPPRKSPRNNPHKNQSLTERTHHIAQPQKGRSVGQRKARLTRRRTNALRPREAWPNRTAENNRQPARSARARPARVKREAPYNPGPDPAGGQARKVSLRPGQAGGPQAR